MAGQWDIFCAVVDNYGDIGVTLRLARQLVAEQGVAVRLWVDDLRALQPLCPATSLTAAQQWLEGIEVRAWTAESAADVVPGEVVIEAFACELPASFIAAMAALPRPPLWLNLEYLSAEDWVAGCHSLPSPQPSGLRKFFFFPGFTEGTGGLLREGDLLARRDALQRDPAARMAFLERLGVTPQADARLVSLFAYENAGLAEWLEAMANGEETVQLLVPQGRIQAQLQDWLGVTAMQPGQVWQRGCLQVQLLSFMPQGDYDRLLWCCDFNAVRGEDSFVRAQWAARPLLWHIYQQAEDAHWDKLEAFLNLYVEGLSEPAALALRGLWRAWNAGQGMGPAWRAMQSHWLALAEHARQWSVRQAAYPDLATALAQFYRNSLSCAA